MSFTASAGTQAEVLPKAGLPPQTQEPRMQIYQGLNRCGSFRCFPHPILSLVYEQILKDLKRFQENQRGGEESGLGYLGASELHRNSPERLNISSIRVLTRSEIRKSQSPFAHIYIIKMIIL